jgi:hypothetical protein
VRNAGRDAGSHWYSGQPDAIAIDEPFLTRTRLPLFAMVKILVREDPVTEPGKYGDYELTEKLILKK